MNTNNIRKKLAFISAAFLLIVAFSSCNRGYGCPYELKSVVKVIVTTIK